MTSVPQPAADPRGFLETLFRAAVARADPMEVMADHLPPRPEGRLLVIGAGKASARMAEAVEAVYGPCEGLVLTRYGYARPCQGIDIVEAAHPVPDRAGLEATTRLLDMLAGLGPEDHVLALISGGGSALLCAPPEGMKLEDKQAVNEALLASGAPISAMNVVRKQLSRVKGGRLGAACAPARLLTLVISDVPGDDPSEIASGPTVADTSTPEQALEVIERWNIAVPASARAALAAGLDPVRPGDPRLARAKTRIVAAPSQSLEAAAALAKQAGCEVRMLGDALEGEARDLAREQARMAREIAEAMAPGDAPVLLLSGGECTVTRRGKGSGGPNAEFALAAAIALEGDPRIHVLACDTDGVDGSDEVAGACAGPDTLAKAGREAAETALAENDAHGFFARVEEQVVTGPTLTNVNDFRALLILPRG
ncbi:hydroxypyruvate reductase [Limimaricola soesokkakensis]|uniref:Hydroxypyruvate reductase n=1 Tax=Limimaricola soesokkakensis TaxID=1343159 RepID=A0A1X6ZSF3_9RHOB|nr:glycerate kinase [Limimaricola soesokkakensis]PSK84031.1 hydroxypyruvate reductase [Limimaricola soesokkakensis]SLN60012.1 Putative hydroxypyruvate reductase [Limimaricola soesokkakensis]